MSITCSIVLDYSSFSTGKLFLCRNEGDFESDKHRVSIFADCFDLRPCFLLNLVLELSGNSYNKMFTGM